MGWAAGRLVQRQVFDLTSNREKIMDPSTFYYGKTFGRGFTRVVSTPKVFHKCGGK